MRAGVLVAVLSVAACTAQPARRDVVFAKTTVDSAFRSEGVALADANGDGSVDLMVGGLWYEAPLWTPHEVAPVRVLNPATEYSDAFLVFASDVNRDGWQDQVVFGFPGTGPYWLENGKGGADHWVKHPVFSAAANESPASAPLLSAEPVLVFQSAGTRMAWFEPSADLSAPFSEHVINPDGAGPASLSGHSLGVGDINGDGLPDVLTSQGFWLAPAWEWKPAVLGPDSAQMHVVDVNADGRPDVISSSAHAVGVWWFEQRADGSFVQHLIDDSFSQSHSLRLADLNGDGQPEVITGKRLWAHGPNGDVDPSGTRLLVWYEFRAEAGEVVWERHVIDESSGVGTQFDLADLNGDGRVDIAVSNKTGVHVFVQQ